MKNISYRLSLVLWCIAILFLLADFTGISVSTIFALSSGPANGRTGSPADGFKTCKDTGCHNSYALNFGKATFSISAPATFTLGEVVPVTISFSNSTTPKHGFELSALDADDKHVGTFSPVDSKTKTDDGKGEYIKHTSAGSSQPGNASWNVKWTAPTSAVQNPVTFYAAGNEANGDFTNQGDYIYTTTTQISSVVSTPTTTPSATPVATPTQTPSTSVTPKIAAGVVHNIALDSDGNIWTWGNNWYGQLGDGTTSNRYTPIRVGSLNDVTAIAGGYMFTLALKSDGTVWAWGFNEYGQLGDGTYGNDKYSVIPIKVQNLSDVIAIACGHSRGIALKSDGTVWVWGWTQYGESKYGGSLDEVSVPNPTQVVELSDVIAIASGGEFTITLKSDGTIWAWGNNDLGQLGDGTNTYSNIPIQVNGLNDVKAIDGGGTHAIALKSDGTVWTWGRNYFGQLGNGTTTDSNTPVQVDDLQDIIAIAAGEGHSFALKKAGTMWTWGRNVKGELGIGTVTTNSPYGKLNPVQVDISDVVAIDGGDGHTIVLKSDGTVYTWGYNKYGQLGSGTTSDSSIPVKVKDLNLYVSTTTPTPTPTITLTTTPTASPTLSPIPSPSVSPTPTPIPSPTSSSSNIFGFVYDSEEEPIQDVTVTIKGDNYSGSTSTDEYGYYELKNLSSGDYTLTYSKEGYQTQTQDVTLEENEEQDLGILTLESIEKGSIFGYVVDFRGNEIDSATIRMKGLHTGYSKTISSDTDGYFEFTDLEADTYILTAKKSGYKQGKRTIKLSEGEARV